MIKSVVVQNSQPFTLHDEHQRGFDLSGERVSSDCGAAAYTNWRSALWWQSIHASNDTLALLT